MRCAPALHSIAFRTAARNRPGCSRDAATCAGPRELHSPRDLRLVPSEGNDAHRTRAARVRDSHPPGTPPPRRERAADRAARSARSAPLACGGNRAGSIAAGVTMRRGRVRVSRKPWLAAGWLIERSQWLMGTNALIKQI